MYTETTVQQIPVLLLCVGVYTRSLLAGRNKAIP